MIITSTGYYATGSSAAFNFLKEYSSCTAGKLADRDYENIIMYTPNGVFDLEDKLLVGNSIHRSDEALNSFYKEMKRLNNYDFDWFGNYGTLLGQEFMFSVDKLIEELTTFEVKGHWSYDFLRTRISIRGILGDLKKLCCGYTPKHRVGERIVYRNKNTIRYSYVSPEVFYTHVKDFVNEYFRLIFNNTGKNLILNHFLLPHNLHRIDKYFDDDLRVIVVERDPRDVFIQEKYGALLRGNTPRIPIEVNDFIDFWRGLRAFENPINDRRIVKIYLEDMIYHYEETKKRIEDSCGLQSADHLQCKKIFFPDKSIENTQLFLIEGNWYEEILQIERELQEYLYDFPFERCPHSDFRNFGIAHEK